MLKFISLLFVIFTLSRLVSQVTTHVNNLPNKLIEISGIEKTASNEYWAHNDGGNPNIIYKLDSNAIINDSLFINYSNNISDWEDITFDGTNLYIGNFGNNNRSVSFHEILVINNINSLNIDTVTPSIIHFVTADEPEDMEAMAFYNGFLYLFSKDQDTITNRLCKVYKSPITLTTAFTPHMLSPIDSIIFPQTQPSFVPTGQITGADIEGNELALLAYDKVHFFTDFTNDDFFNGVKTTYNLSLVSQWEGITFQSISSLYIANEGRTFRPIAPPSVKRINKSVTNLNELVNKEINFYPNPSTSVIHFNRLIESVEIYNANGTLIDKQFKNNKINISTLSKGAYFIRLKENNKIIIKQFIKQ